MRVIKFRAWDREEKTMIDADSWYFSEEFEPFIDSVEKAMRRFDLMQFTGLLDKNGTEIYAGEWMETGYRDDPGSLIGFVEYQARSARWGIRVGHRLIEFGKRGRWYECLGKNIYQHPDLLKKESP